MFQIPIAVKPAVSDSVPVLRDIIRVEISPTGAEPFGACADITIQGFTTGKEIDFGSGYGSQLSYSDIANAKFVFTVVSEGFDSSGNLGTITRTVYGTSVVRKPYPDHTSSQDTTTVIRIALSEFIYDDDKNGGAGTSGVDPRVTIKFGAIRNTGASSELNNPVTNFKCVNSSTLDYAKSISKWDRIAGTFTADRIKTDFPMACRTYHRFGTACVRFDAVGRTSAHTETVFVNTKTSTQRTATSLYTESYLYPNIPLTGFSQGELIDLRFRTYPIVGDLNSVIDTNDNTSSTDECLLKNISTVICDKSGTLDVFAVIDSTSGNNGTGVVSSTLATAEASPYLNINSAISAGANIIYLKNGTHSANGTSITRKTTNEWIVVTYHPTLSSKSAAIVQVNSTTRNYRTQRLQFKNITFDLLNTTSYLDGENTGNFLRFSGVTFSENAVGAPTTGVGYRSYATYLENCDGDMGEQEWDWRSFSTNKMAYCFDGCNFGNPGTPSTSNSLAAYELVASYGLAADIRFSALNPDGPVKDSVEIAFNEFYSNPSSSANFFTYADTTGDEVYTGLAIIGNIYEKTAGTSALGLIGGDNAVCDVNNVLLWHNTFCGERMNLGYNDQGTVGYSRRNWSQKFNSFRDWNNKDDTFGTPNSNRIKCWPIGYGVGFLSNNYETSTFPGEYPGFDLTIGSPSYVANNSYTGTGTGNGDYTPNTGSTLIGRIPTGQRVITCDLFGNNIVENGDIGAIQVTV